MAFHALFKKVVVAVAAAALIAGWLAAGEFAGRTDGGCGGAPSPASSPRKDLKVKVFTEREGDATRFFVDNRELCDITMTFELSMVNLRGAAAVHTASFPPDSVTEAFVLEPERPGEKWEFSYTNYFKLGGHCVEHDPACLYELPYAPGRKFKVTQAFGGSYSHKGSNKYAIDWKMPEGTPVHAARGGKVVKVKQDSDLGGPSIEFDRYNNYVLIQHEDGTLGHYCHLQQHGIVVKPGQVVAAGELLAKSGNTGFSSGPHLHFCVFRTISGRERVSVPIRFRTAEGAETTLTSGNSYRAPALDRNVGGTAER